MHASITTTKALKSFKKNTKPKHNKLMALHIGEKGIRKYPSNRTIGDHPKQLLLLFPVGDCHFESSYSSLCL